MTRGYGDRVTLTLGDACAIKYRDEFAQVDLLKYILHIRYI